MTPVLTLPTRLDSAAAVDLKSDISGHAGQDLTLDASGLDHLGALCAQVLLSARATWAADNKRFEIRDMPLDVEDDLQHLGLTVTELEKKDQS